MFGLRADSSRSPTGCGWGIMGTVLGDCLCLCVLQAMRAAVLVRPLRGLWRNLPRRDAEGCLFMRFPPLVPAQFVERVNRFCVTVWIEDAEVDAHLPNSGRLTELLTSGRRCWVHPVSSPHRKTAFDLKLVEYSGILVSVDARLPNPLFAEALEEKRLAPFQGYSGFDREVPLGESRIDFRLRTPSGLLWVETKSVTLVEDGVALFPDAPTARGRRHVQALVDAVREGTEAAIVFIVQRPDARSFAAADAADPAFGEILRSAADAGVGLYAWTCRVSKATITIARQIPVDLP